MKIAVIGYSGSGKSTLAREIGEKYNIDVLHLDKVHWMPEWQTRPLDDKLKIVKDFMDSHSSWIIDGNYANLFYDRRMEEADKIVFMSFNRFSCLWRAFKRYFTYKGTSRDSMTQGCDEKFDCEFIRWILHEGRAKKHRDRYRSIIRTYSDKAVIIKNQYQLDIFRNDIMSK
ncbi:MAG: DNA topology modulation protein [Candidatus Ornithomonoglobus sp.]